MAIYLSFVFENMHLKNFTRVLNDLILWKEKNSAFNLYFSLPIVKFKI